MQRVVEFAFTTLFLTAIALLIHFLAFPRESKRDAMIRRIKAEHAAACRACDGACRIDDDVAGVPQ